MDYFALMLRHLFRPEIKTLPLVEEEGDFKKEKEAEHLDDLYVAIKNGDLLAMNNIVARMDESSFASIRFYVGTVHKYFVFDQIYSMSFFI